MPTDPTLDAQALKVAFDAPYPRPPLGTTKVPFDASPAPIPGGKVPFDAQQPQPYSMPTTAPTADTTVAKPAATMPPGAVDMGNNLVKLSNGQMVPRDHPIYLAAMQAAGLGPAATPAAGAPAPAAPTGYGDPAPAASGNPIADQAAKASTYSATPGADTDQSTMNQGAQDVYRNTLLKQATQDTKVDTNDPTFRAAADTHAAADERARRNATDMTAESLAANGAGSSGAMDNERRMQTEKAAQSSAGFESQLALSELQNKRAEIQSAIQQLGTSIGGDQARALTQKLADLDATIKRESLAQSGQLGNKDIDSRNTLGTAGLNLQGMGLLLNNQQNNNQLGAQIGMNNATLNAQSLRALLGL